MTRGTEEPYPRHWEADALASDGGVLHIRPIRPDDADQIVGLHSRMSERTRYLRYFGPYPQIPPRDLERFTVVDYRARVALVAEVGGQLIAVGRYERLPDEEAAETGGAETGGAETGRAETGRAGTGGAGTGGAGTGGAVTAEVAFVVEDAHQGRGVGSVLLEHLAAAARERGIEQFEAYVLAENPTMVRVFLDAGYQVRRAYESGLVHLTFGIEPTAESVAVTYAREQRAEARSIQRLLTPRSVAVIGASADPHKIGHVVFHNLLAFGPHGPVYPINPETRHVAGVRAYPSVLDVPEDIDLAVVAVPARAVPGVVEQCAAKNVRGLVVVSAGFADLDEAGAAAQRELVAAARQHGMRVVGPNCLGVLNTDPAVRLNATLAPLTSPQRGRVGFFSQSGALGVALLAEAGRRGLGLTTFVSAGNRADVSGNDLLQYWEDDEATEVVLLYLESFGNPRKFARLARRVARSKPVVAVRSGRHAAGLPELPVYAAPVPEERVPELFARHGVIQVETVAELFDVAQLLAYQPLPASRRVAVVTNSTALGTLAADACARQGLAADRPLDIGAEASAGQFAAALDAVRGDGGVGALVVVFVPPLATPGEAVAQVLAERTAGWDRPVVSTFLAMDGVPEQLRQPSPDGGTARGSVPSYTSPERAVRALAHAARYAEWRREPAGTVPALRDVDPLAAREPIAAALAGTPTGRDLDPAETATLLAAYGIPYQPPGAEPAGREPAAGEPVLGGDGEVVAGEASRAGESAPGGDGGVVAEVAGEAPRAGEPGRGGDGGAVAEVAGKAPRDGEPGRGGGRGVVAEVAGEAPGAGESARGGDGEAVAGAVGEASRAGEPGRGGDGVVGDGQVGRRAEERPVAGGGVVGDGGAGVACVVGVVDDPSFGALVSFGIAGIATELLGDRAYAAVPLTDEQASALVRAPRAAPLLDGYRGAEPVDHRALRDLLLRVARLADDHPEVLAAELNPVHATTRGLTVASARIRVGPPTARTPVGPRRMQQATGATPPGRLEI